MSVPGQVRPAVCGRVNETGETGETGKTGKTGWMRQGTSVPGRVGPALRGRVDEQDAWRDRSTDVQQQ
jgi:hypothetical protein